MGGGGGDYYYIIKKIDMNVTFSRRSTLKVPLNRNELASRAVVAALRFERDGNPFEALLCMGGLWLGERVPFVYSV